MLIQIILIIGLINYILFFLNKNKKINALYCGIIGFSGTNNSNYDPFKIRLLTLFNNLERGGDGIGLYTNKEDKIYKDLGSTDYINKNFLDTLNTNLSNILIAHARKGSIGTNSISNIHPFEYGDIIGCHNGTLKNWIKLAGDAGIKGSDYDTDSQVIYQLLSKDTKEIPDILKNYEGTAALLYYNKVKKSLFAFRDNERPLFMGTSSEGLYFSSLEYTLDAINCTNIISLETNCLYEIKEGKIIKLIKNIVKKDLSLLSMSLPAIDKGVNNTKYKGILGSLGSLEYIKGLSLKYTGEKYYSSKEEIDSFTPGEYYEIESSDTFYLKVKDNNFKLRKIYYSNFDVTNTFFIKGCKAIALTDISSVAKNHLICKKGEELEVVFYTVGGNVVEVRKNGKLYSCPIHILTPLNTPNDIESIEEFIDYTDVPFEQDYPNISNDFISIEELETFLEISIEKISKVKDMVDVENIQNTFEKCLDINEFKKYIK